MRSSDDDPARPQAADQFRSQVHLGEYLVYVKSTLTDMERRSLVARIWDKDPSLWREDPAQQVELAGRLGWLTVTDVMGQQVENLQSFAEEIRQAGIRHVVLLGMGGSSLSGEVFRQCFGPFPTEAGYPELLVLDSTVPASVEKVADAIDPAASLFLVSSKSGATIEPLCFYRYFRRLVETAVGTGQAGGHFAAVTDAGSPLGGLANHEGFRRIFLNPADIGGRYSVLSYFGLVPVALIGMDLKLLLRRADGMRERCAPWVPAPDNPGAWLGATIGTLALRGRDKLTLLTSPSITSFGLWVEQLIAESTGKEGKGIVPVVDEPLLAPEAYGPDRQFVFLRLEGDDSAALDMMVQALQQAGQPVVCLALRDRYDLGAEFFRWELATVVAGALIGINPFDEPDVQRSKDNTTRVLEVYQREGRLPRPVGASRRIGTAPALNGFLSQSRPGDYLSVMAYIAQTPDIDALLHELRVALARLAPYPIATTLGHGPRFLHSTAQLHKGGPATGLYLQITADHPQDLPIPGQPYTFGVLVAAQAIGDREALQSLGRREVQFHLGADPVVGLRRLLDELK